MTEIENMIEYCTERGDLEFELNGVSWGICSTVWGNKPRPTYWYFCDQNGFMIEEWGEFPSVRDIFNAKVFDGKSIIDLWEHLDFSMN